jgi:cob(I)alamin adenosyltransferase
LTNGLIQVYYGNGKGKTTAASGLILRALHYKYKILIAQFLKTEKWQAGEVFFFKKHPLCRVLQSRYTHPGFYGNKKPDDGLLKEDQTGLLNRASAAMGEGYDIVLMDEALDSFTAGFIGRQDLETFLDRKPKETEIILTGRKCPDFVRRRAGLMTDFLEIKHPYRDGMPARKGMEY